MGLKLTAEDIQRHLRELADTIRGDADPFDEAMLITVLWTLKVLLDNRVYFSIRGMENWQTIMAQDEDVAARLGSVVAAVEEQIPQLSEVFSEIDLRFLDYRILERLTRQLERYDFSYEAVSDSDPLDGTIATAADAWFEQLADLSGKRGDFLTPKPVKVLCSQLLKVQSGSTYDGTAGVAGMLVEAAREAKRNGSGEVELFGQELNESAWRMAQMNLVLHGVVSAHFARGDVLMKPEWTEGSGVMRFHYVMMNPPFASRLLNKEQRGELEEDSFRRYRYGRPSAAFADLAFVQHAIASLNETGRGVVVQPHGALFRGGIDAKIRAGIIADHLVESVVFLPRNLLFNTGIPVALLVLNRQNPHPGQILFIRADEDYQAGRLQNMLRPMDIDKICDVHHLAREVDGYSRLVNIEDF